MTNTHELLGSDKAAAQRYADCLLGIGPQRDLSGYIQPEPLEQKHALCTQWAFADDSFHEESELSRLGMVFNGDLAELRNILKKPEPFEDCRWRAAEAQFSIVSNIDKKAHPVSSPDVVRCRTKSEGLMLEITETASIHLVVISKQSFNVLAQPDDKRTFAALQVLQTITTIGEEALREALQQPLNEGSFEREDDKAAELWFKATCTDQPLLAVRDGALHILMAKLPSTPPTVPITYRGVDPAQYLPPMLKTEGEEDDLLHGPGTRPR